MKKILLFIVYVLLFSNTYFVTLEYLKNSSENITYHFFMGVVEIILFFMIGKIFLQYSVYIFLRIKNVQLIQAYVFPFILYKEKKVFFVDPMLFVRTREYFLYETSERIEKEVQRFLSILMVVSASCLGYIYLQIGWSIFLYAPIFLCWFITLYRSYTPKEISINNSISIIGKDTTSSINLSDIPIHFITTNEVHLLNLILVFYDIKKEQNLNRQIIKEFIDNVEINHKIYLKFDIYLISYWKANRLGLAEIHDYRYNIYKIVDIDTLDIIQNMKVVPLHLKYYSKLLDIIYSF